MTKAFLLGIHELEKQVGPEETDQWMRNIGEKLAEAEGAGLMGEQKGDLYYFPICLFAPKLNEFIEDMGESPEGHKEILEFVKARYQGPKGPAAVNVCCSMCHAYRKKRGQLGGKKDLLHLGAKYRVTEEVAYSDEAIKKSGHTKEEIKEMLDKFDCVCMYLG